MNPARFHSLSSCPVTPKDEPSQCSLSGGLSPAFTSRGGSFFLGASRSEDRAEEEPCRFVALFLPARVKAGSGRG